MNIAQAKSIAIEDYLLQCGHAPIRRVNGSLWYKSPLRVENTPSFKVNQHRNAWYDFGIGKGGDLLDLVKAMEGTSSITEVLNRIRNRAPSPRIAEPRSDLNPTPEKPTELVSVGPVTSPSLLSYLRSRAIDPELVSEWVKEVRYRRSNREFFGLGFANDSGGFEIRTQEFKGSLGAKTLTTLPGQSSGMLLFEGFFDFLSYVAIHGKPKQTVIVLNSVSLRDRAAQVINSRHPLAVEVFRHRDTAGEHTLEYLREACPSTSFVDRSGDYPNHKDLNEWLQEQATSLDAVC